MERESNSMQALCRSGCGFYGNPSTDGLCSLCYKEALKKKQQPPSTGLHARSELATAAGAVGGGSPYGSTTNGGTQYGASPAAHQVLMETATAVPTIPVIGSAPNTSSSSSCSTSSSSSGEHNKDCDGEASGGVSGESGAELDDSLDSGKEDKDSKKKKHRCAMCRKKVGLTGFECRCGGLYCAVHRYSDKHECTFDYRELGAQEIRRNNPVVVGEKIQKI